MNALDRLIDAVEAGEATGGQVEYLAANAIDISITALDVAAAYSFSDLNAVLVLQDTLLPEWQWQVFQVVDGKYIAVLDGPTTSTPEMEAPTPARAWLLAILSAYRSQQEAGR